jgi:prepilin-type N-terminal cleavage/methylation domain-containing protein
METLTVDARSTDTGFSLIEVLIAMLIVTIGAFALHASVVVSARKITGSQEQFIASQRAAEAIESVFKARDNRVLAWAQIRNVLGASGSDGGIFVDGAAPVRDPGPDGLSNTADDLAVATVIRPGPDGLLGTPDDISQPLFGFTREIEIREISATLRQLRVIVRYRSSTGTGQYVLVTYVSAYA